MDDIRVEVNGRPAVTARMLAAERGVSLAAIRMALHRADVQPVARLNGHALLYDRDAVVALLDGRPGRRSRRLVEVFPGPRPEVTG